MPVFLLGDTREFPEPALAERDGLLAAGGDLRPERLIAAYRQGIFPWTSEGQPLLWWCPAPRMVLLPAELVIGRSLRKSLRRLRGHLRVTLDRDFSAVLAACAAAPRPGQDGTWLFSDLQRAMLALHMRGIAHSVEVWEGEALVAGLYGLALGGVFFGESMFTRRPDASKFALVTLVGQLERWGFAMIDCQQATEHLRRFGARELALGEFLQRLAAGVALPGRPGSWHFEQVESRFPLGPVLPSGDA